MVLFGKELKLESNFNPKEAKMFAVFISILVILGLGYVLVYTPTMTIKSLNNEIETKNKEKETVSIKKTEAENKLADSQRLFEEQNENYLKTKEKFIQASVINDTGLKDMVAQIAEKAQVKIVSTGAPEVIEENEEFIKKYFPYEVETDVNRLGRFLYWLENSNQLVTFKGSPLEVKLDQAVPGLIVVKLKIGAYFNLGKMTDDILFDQTQANTSEGAISTQTAEGCIS